MFPFGVFVSVHIDVQFISFTEITQQEDRVHNYELVITVTFVMRAERWILLNLRDTFCLVVLIYINIIIIHDEMSRGS